MRGKAGRDPGISCWEQHGSLLPPTAWTGDQEPVSQGTFVGSQAQGWCFWEGMLLGWRSPEHEGLLCLIALREGQARRGRGLAAKGRKERRRK